MVLILQLVTASIMLAIAASDNAIISLLNGTLLHCQLDEFTCENLNNEEDAAINAIFVVCDVIYTGMNSGIVYGCKIHKRDSCWYQDYTDTPINALYLKNGYIYAGSENGFIRRCVKDERDSCVTIYIADGAVKSIAVNNYHVYAGLNTGVMLKCSLSITYLSCEIFNKASVPINSLALFENEYIFAGLNNGLMWKCPLNLSHSCIDFNFAGSSINALSITGDRMYAGLNSTILWICSVRTPDSCVDLYKTDWPITAFATY